MKIDHHDARVDARRRPEDRDVEQVRARRTGRGARARAPRAGSRRAARSHGTSGRRAIATAMQQRRRRARPTIEASDERADDGDATIANAGIPGDARPARLGEAPAAPSAGHVAEACVAAARAHPPSGVRSPSRPSGRKTRIRIRIEKTIDCVQSLPGACQARPSLNAWIEADHERAEHGARAGCRCRRAPRR